MTKKPLTRRVSALAWACSVEEAYRPNYQRQHNCHVAWGHEHTSRYKINEIKFRAFKGICFHLLIAGIEPSFTLWLGPGPVRRRGHVGQATENGITVVLFRTASVQVAVDLMQMRLRTFKCLSLHSLFANFERNYMFALRLGLGPVRRRGHFGQTTENGVTVVLFGSTSKDLVELAAMKARVSCCAFACRQIHLLDVAGRKLAIEQLLRTPFERVGECWRGGQQERGDRCHGSETHYGREDS